MKEEVPNQEEVKDTIPEPSKTEPQKKSFEIGNILKNKFVLIGGSLIIVSIIIVSIIMLIPKDSDAEMPMFYISEDGELKFLFYDYKEPVTLAKESDGDVSYEVRKDNKRMLFVNNDNLYEVDLTKKKDNVEKIANDVYSFGYSDEGDYIYYVNSDDVLYSYYKKEKTKLDSDVYDVNQTFLDYLLYEKDDKVYLRSFDDKKDEKIKLGGTTGLQVSKDNSKILYTVEGKNYDDGYDVYIYTIKSNDKKKIIDNVSDLVYINDNLDKLIYTRDKDDEIDAKDLLFTDKMYDEDMKALDEYIYKSYYKDEYYYYDDDYNRVVVTEEEYNAYLAREERDDIRDEIDYSMYDYSMQTKDVYVYENSKEAKLAEDIYETTAAKTEKDVELLFTQLSFSGKKLEISEITEDDVEEQFEKLTTKLYYSIDEEDPVELLSYSTGAINGEIRNKKVYVTLTNDDYEDDLYVFTKGKKIRDSKEKVASNIENISFVSEDSDDVVYVAGIKNNKGDLMIYSGNKEKTIVEDMSTYYYIDEAGDIFYYSDYDDDDYTGNYSVYSNGKNTLLAEDISYAYPLDKNRAFIYKDCSEKSETCDLYKLKNKKLILVEYGVSSE